MKFFIQITLVLLCVFSFSIAQAQEKEDGVESSSPKAEAKTEAKTKTEAKAQQNEETKTEKDLPPDLVNSETPMKKSLSKSDEKELFDSERYETIDVELDYKPNPAADAVFVFFNYLSMAAIVAMIVFVSLWFLKNKNKKSPGATVKKKSAQKDEDEAVKKEEEKEEKEEDA